MSNASSPSGQVIVPQLAPIRVLLVEDDSFLRSVVARCLAAEGYEVAQAEDGKQGVGLLALERFDIVLTDIQMPGMTGLELLTWARSNCSTPVLLMSGFSDLGDAHDARAMGAAGYLAKPVKKEDLILALRSCLLAGSASDPGSDPGSEATPAPAPASAPAAPAAPRGTSGGPANGRSASAPVSSSSSSPSPSSTSVTPAARATEPSPSAIGNATSAAAVASAGAGPSGEYCMLSIDDFVTGREIRFDIFIRLPGDKYVKIAHCGEDLSRDRIDNYKQRGLRHLYLRKEDFRSYVGMNMRLTQALRRSDLVSKEKKLHFLKHTGEMIAQSAFESCVDRDSLEQAKTVVETTVSVLTEDEDVFELLDALNNNTDFLYAHSVAVSVYSAMIARKLGWTSTPTLFKASTAGLLHDIGLKEIDRAILTKPRRRLSQDEVRLIESHPQRSREILSETPSVPSEIAQIVYQHHENCQGTGYPSHLRRSKIHPLAKLLAVADEFCDLVLQGPNRDERLAPNDAIERMVARGLEHYDLRIFSALMQLFNYTYPEGFNTLLAREETQPGDPAP